MIDKAKVLRLINQGLGQATEQNVHDKGVGLTLHDIRATFHTIYGEVGEHCTEPLPTPVPVPVPAMVTVKFGSAEIQVTRDEMVELLLLPLLSRRPLPADVRPT